MNNITCLDYESEAEYEDLSMFRYDQFQDACCWEKIPPKSISLLSVCVFPIVNVFLEGGRAGC